MTPFSGLFRPFLDLNVVDLRGSSGYYRSNNCDTIVISQLQIVIICTRTMSFSVITIHFDDKRRQSLVSFMPLKKTVV